MKIQIASDMHLEGHYYASSIYNIFHEDIERDVLILAGDICDGGTPRGLQGSKKCIEFMLTQVEISPVVYITGNHEYYHSSKSFVNAFWRDFANETENFYFLNNDTVEIDGVTFFGAEWCSNFWNDLSTSMMAGNTINDFYHVKNWDVRSHVGQFNETKQKLLNVAGTVDVVVTHNPPTKQAIDLSRYEGDKLNPYFINDEEELVKTVGASCWFAGHTHSPAQYRIDDTLVVINPTGYHHEGPKEGYEKMKTIILEDGYARIEGSDI